MQAQHFKINLVISLTNYVKYDTLFMCLKFEESIYFGGQNVICYCAMRIISFKKFTTNHWKNANKQKTKAKTNRQTNKQKTVIVTIVVKAWLSTSWHPQSYIANH